MERGFFVLSLTLLWRLLFFKSGVITVSIPLILLVLVMGLSVTQFLQSYIAEDFIGAAAVSTSTVILASSLKLNDVARGIAIGGITLAVLSLGTLWLSPEKSWAPEGKFIGIYSHWNSLGLSLLLGVAAIIGAQFSSKSWLNLLIKLSGLIVVGLPIYLSNSKNSWVTFLCLVTAGIILWIYKFSKLIFAASIALTAGFVVFAYFNSAWLLGLLEKDSSISGRTGIWQAAMNHIGDRPWLGYGWARIFPPDSIIGGYITTESQIPAFHSHNDFLNWYLTTGVFGLLLVLVLYVTILSSGFLSLKKQTTGSAWLLVGALELLISGLVEVSSFQLQGWFVFSLLVSTAAVWISQDKNRRMTLNATFSIPTQSS
jgi:O-antigen ligase